jgi:hypothetical protein
MLHRAGSVVGAGRVWQEAFAVSSTVAQRMPTVHAQRSIVVPHIAPEFFCGLLLNAWDGEIAKLGIFRADL